MSTLKELIKHVEESLKPEIKDAPVIKLRKPSEKVTSANRDSFFLMCRARFKQTEAIAKLKESLDATNERITSFVLRKGVMVREEDRAFYVHPYKAQVEVVRQPGSIDTEVLRAFDEKAKLNLFDAEETKLIDFVKVKNYIDSGTFAPKVKDDLLDALNLIEQIARDEKVNAVSESSETFLNLERYDAAKKTKDAKGKALIPEEIVKKAEANLQVKHRLSVDLITGTNKDRCPACSTKKPKKRADDLYQCKRCGTKS